jgi:VWFA-related protein
MRSNPLVTTENIAGKPRVCFGRSSLLAGTVLCAASLLAQQGISPDEVRVSSRAYFPNQPIIRVQTTEVRVAAVVRDAGLKPVTGLQKQDFDIYDQGRKQTILGFSVLAADGNSAVNTLAGPTNAPAPAGPAISTDQPRRYVAFFFDDINTQQGELAGTLVAARKYVTDVMMPRDRLAIFTASDTQTLDFTDAKTTLLAVLERIRLHPR